MSEYTEIENLFKKLWPEIYKYIYYRVQNAEEAEELTQETFSRVYPKLKDKTIKKTSYRAYIYSTAKNIITDLWRKRVRHPEVVGIEDYQLANITDDEKELEKEIVIQKALNKLPSQYKEVLVLRIIEGYSSREVAKKIGKTEGAVRSLQFRAVKSLRDLLEKEGYFNE